MMEPSRALRVSMGGIALGLLLIAAGCTSGPLAPTPGFGDEVRANRLAMIENPDATAENPEPVDGIKAPTAKGVVENYHYNERADNQERRQKTLKQSDIKF